MISNSSEDRFNLLTEVKNGFRFNCKACSRCCTGKDDGYVFVYSDEIGKIAKFLKIGLKTFFTKYCDIIDSEYKIFDEDLKPTKKKIYLNSIVLKQNKDDGKCIFLEDNNKCKIYKVRPNQCESWPVWYMNMTKLESFKEAMDKCPGLHGNDIGENKDSDSGSFFTNNIINEILIKEISQEQEYIKIMKKNKCDIKKIYPFLKSINIEIK